MRKLVTLNKIESLTPINGADRIETAKIKGWNIIVQKGLHNVGDWVTFFEIDSFIPKGLQPFAKDLEPRGIRKSQLETGEVIEGYKIGSLKLRGVISQGYIVPFSSYSKEQQAYFNSNLKDDFDITKYLGIFKFEKPETGSERQERVKQIPKTRFGLLLYKVNRWLQKKFPSIFKKHSGEFPNYLHRTECQRIQNYANQMYEHWLNDTLFQVSVKLDGSSISIYKKDKLKGICSREKNKNLKEITDKFVHEGLIIHNKLKEHKKTNWCIQGELIGPKIQGNFEGVNLTEIHVYSIWDIDKQQYLNPTEVADFCFKWKLKHVPIIHEGITLKQLFPNIKDANELVIAMLAYAEGPSALNGKYREGLVYKQLSDGYKSIKTISNSYLIKNDG